MHNSAAADLLRFVNEKILKNTMTVEPDTLLFKDNVIDSMNVLTLIGYVENKLARTLNDDELVMHHFKSVDAIAKHFFSQ